MKKIEYYKLIRDNIPAIIEKSGKSYSIIKLDDKDYTDALKSKLIEEGLEVKNAYTKNELINELADVYEVIEAIKKIYNISSSEIEKVQKKKANENGKFDKHLCLEYVIEVGDVKDIE